MPLDAFTGVAVGAELHYNADNMPPALTGMGERERNLKSVVLIPILHAHIHAY